MNCDIRLSSGFWQHPKTARLVKRLGLEGVRSLQVLWCWAANNRCTGELTGMDAEDIEFAASWNGDAGAFCAACIELKWIDMHNGVYVIHDWSDHNGWAANDSARADKARYSRLCRENPDMAKRLKENGIVAITSAEYQRYKYDRTYDRSTTVDNRTYDRTTTVCTPIPIPIPIPVDSIAQSDCVGGEAEIGEKPLCAETAEGGDSPPTMPQDSPVVMEIPLIPRDGLYAVTDADVQFWSAAYPGLDVPATLRRIASWMDANPNKRKTRRGIRRCIDSWLARDQDNGKTIRVNHSSSIGGLTFQ